MTEHSTQEFDLMYKGRIQYVTAKFYFSAWVDCYDPQDSRSEFIEVGLGTHRVGVLR